MRMFGERIRAIGTGISRAPAHSSPLVSRVTAFGSGYSGWQNRIALAAFGHAQPERFGVETLRAAFRIRLCALLRDRRVIHAASADAVLAFAHNANRD
ncbi:hypothetical protein T5B8_14495 [Salinisphaera sp. T5B8]